MKTILIDKYEKNRLILKRHILPETAFTLLETLVAMVVLAIILLFLYFIFKTTIRNRSLAVNSGKPYIEANLIFTQFHKKITEFNYLYPVFIASYNKGGKNDGQKLSFLYFSGLSKTPVPFSKNESKENVNYFYLKRLKNKNINKKNNSAKKIYELIYEQSFFKRKGGNVKISLDRVVIARNLTFLNIKYYYNGLWLEKFNYASYNSVPEAIKLKFGLFINGRIKKFKYQFSM